LDVNWILGICVAPFMVGTTEEVQTLLVCH